MKSPMDDISRLLSRQKFENKEEMQAFLNSLIGKSLDEFPVMDLTIEEQAQDLVAAAYDLPAGKAKKNIEKALELVPNCIDAYEYLASREKKWDKLQVFLEKGIAIGREKFGGKYLKQNKGNFWLCYETRPFMRCLFEKAKMLICDAKIAESVQIMEELIELNTNDNQGVRYWLLSILLLLGDTKKFRKYDKMVADDTYSAAILYSRALFAFKTEGDTPNARKQLTKAFKANPFVVHKLLEIKKVLLPESYNIGSPEEADQYLLYGYIPWVADKAATEWLVDVTSNMMSKAAITSFRKNKK
jgi:tetratricopeptide (TPR) repeat protein